ncbi:hypothetical protein [Rhodohalobacter mucosus]|uniref:HEAT repeat protein n=1 Tax=Rhodohalobacter mucosus TaxID=2079485 RepID=A0A316TMU6_9BACT|nr:hypothetical protein [Rhodohalobacter mucosus]PWN05917.1 hypothetical protein DDZ15_12080 [Rhodohalobacter mucosus]
MENFQLIITAQSSLFWDPSTRLLWLVTMALLGSTLFLFIYTLGLRYLQIRKQRQTERFERTLLPALFQYLDGDIGRRELEKLTGTDKLKCKVFKENVIELLKNLEGDEAVKLRSALVIKPIYDYHLQLLQSNDPELKIKACSYFRYMDLNVPFIIRLLKKEVLSDNTFLAFSAASALMGSPDLATRSYALGSLAKNRKLSEMAIMEMFYRFRNEDLNQEEEESDALMHIVSDPEITPENRAVLIRCAAESNFCHLADTFYQWLRSKEDMWNNPVVLTALIDSQRIFLNLDAADYIVRFLYHSDKKIALAAENSVGELTSREFASAIGHPIVLN